MTVVMQIASRIGLRSVLSKHHIHCGSLGSLAVGGVHLAEIPFQAEKDVSAHYELVSVLFVVGRDRVGQVAGLVEDVVDFEAEGESLDVLRYFPVPLPFRSAVTGRVADVPFV